MSAPVDATAPAAAPGPAAAPEAGATRSLRGSLLLLVGRCTSVLATLVVQAAVVRHLSTTDFGAFAYALAVANLLAVAVGLGMEQALQRVVAVFDERGQQERVRGALLLHLGAVAAMTAVTGAGLAVALRVAGHAFLPSERAGQLVLVMFALAPLQALDGLATSLFAVHARAGAIFVRRYVVAPGLKVAVAVAVVTTGAGVEALATGWVLASAVGTAAYLPFLLRMLRERGVLRRGPVVVPVRDLLGFTVRALAADLVVVLLFGSDAVVVGAVSDVHQVALLQAVQPVANGNLLVFYAMLPLFVPEAARLVTRGATAQLGDLYARTTAWTVVLTAPVLLVTAGAAVPVCVALFGEEYRESGRVLALLALGQYAVAALGLTGLVLKAADDLRALIAVNVVLAVANVSANLMLASRWGALGAACGTAATLLLLTAAKCVLLRPRTAVDPLPPLVRRPLAQVVAAALALHLWQAASGAGLVASVAVAALASAALLVTQWRALDVDGVLPLRRALAAARRARPPHEPPAPRAAPQEDA